MASTIDICNLALSLIGQGKQIAALTENSNEARVCSLHFNFVRDQILEDAPWARLTKVERMATLDPDTFDSFDWARAYQYPSDALKITRLFSDYSQISTNNRARLDTYYYDYERTNSLLMREIEYEIRNINNQVVILSNESNLSVEYVSRQTDVNLFSNKLVMAMAHLLASRIATAVVGWEAGNELSKVQLQLYSLNLKSAISDDLNMRSLDQKESDFITIRD